MTFSFNGELHTSGSVPPADAVATLAAWCAEGGAEVFVTDALEKDYDGPAAHSADAAGVLYHALSSGGAHYIIWFRQERTDDVLWAGDPAKAIVKDENGLSPRKSFEQWRQRMRGQSRPWPQSGKTAASNLAHALQKQLSLILLEVKERRYRLLTEQLQTANEELERINWISTHDLQEPLRKIQVFGSRLLGSEAAQTASPDIIHAVSRMNDAAGRMQTLVNDIHAYSKLLHKESPLELISLGKVANSVLHELADELADAGAAVNKDALPDVMGEPFLLWQVFTNLLRNALKFSREGISPVIRITVVHVVNAMPPSVPLRPEGYHRISIADKGIGFSNEYADAIFGIFRRLHTQKEYGGTGIGLALCRKVMLRHNGYATAEGISGEGAVFHLWFQCKFGFWMLTIK